MIGNPRSAPLNVIPRQEKRGFVGRWRKASKTGKRGAKEREIDTRELSSISRDLHDSTSSDFAESAAFVVQILISQIAQH
jgi:hypothetical protein